MGLTFIKLDINILNDSKIKLIRNMPEGESLLVLWIGILCIAMKSGTPGMIEIGDGIPFTDESLSVELGIQLPTVRLGLTTFQRFKMIEVFEDGSMFIVNFNKHQQIERVRDNAERSRIRSKRYRDKIKMLPSSDDSASRERHANVTQTSNVTNENVRGADIDTDLDSDKDIKHVTDVTCSSTVETVDGCAPVENSVLKCPHAEIIAMWNRLMPELPHVRVWGDKSRGNLQARWRSRKETQDLSWWEGFFIYIRGSDFLMGKKKEFKASLDWVVKPTNFEKIVNGNYENTGMTSTGSRITDQNMRAVKEFLDG